MNDRLHQIHDCRIYSPTGQLKRVVTGDEQFKRTMDRMLNNTVADINMNLLGKVCPTCDAEFKTTNPRQRYCQACNPAKVCTDRL